MTRFLRYALLPLILCQTAFGQSGGKAGAFARMGFGARGIAMGNAMTAVADGDIISYYNPALNSFIERKIASVSFGILSFDRYLNFLTYSQPIRPTAGISVSLINAGVRNIDGRDNDGNHTEYYSTFENQVSLAFSNQIENNFSAGVAIKLYYSKLFDKVKSTTVGFDVGFAAKITENIALAGAWQDLNSKYKWDTKPLYDLNGKTTTDPFPNLRRIGITYRLASKLLFSVDFENSSVKTNIFRAGTEYEIIQDFTVRGGLDRLVPEVEQSFSG